MLVYCIIKERAATETQQQQKQTTEPSIPIPVCVTLLRVGMEGKQKEQKDASPPGPVILTQDKLEHTEQPSLSPPIMPN